MQHGVRSGREPRAQAGREVPIDLDGIEGAAHALEQSVGQCAASGSYLNQMIAGARGERARDARDDRRVVQKVLAETLAPWRTGGATRGARHQRRCVPASWAARRTAASRLRTSALPVPAKSSAVP